MARRSYNDSMGQEREETGESEDYERNKKVRKGHLEDSRFDEGSTHGIESAKIVRPSTGGYAKGGFFKYLGKK